MFSGWSDFVYILLAGAATGFLGSLLVARVLARRGAFQQYRPAGPRTHFAKGEIPTAGGIVFIAGISVFWGISLVLWQNLNFFLSPWEDAGFVSLTIVCAGTVLLGLVGLADDLIKIYGRQTLGLPARYKFAFQLLIGAIASYLLIPRAGAVLVLPLSDAVWELSMPLFVVIGALAFAGFVNGVNFTDGMDGLAAGTVIIALIGILLVSAMVSGQEIPSVSVAAMGLVLGFFALNLKPARLFMGDTGSYALGALIALLCISSGLVLFALLIGIVFLIEVLSVMLQVASFRLTGRRIFRMSPLHHHFEESGRSEESVVAGFWVVQAVGCVAAVLLAI